MTYFDDHHLQLADYQTFHYNNMIIKDIQFTAPNRRSYSILIIRSIKALHITAIIPGLMSYTVTLPTNKWLIDKLYFSEDLFSLGISIPRMNRPNLSNAFIRIITQIGPPSIPTSAHLNIHTVFFCLFVFFEGWGGVGGWGRGGGGGGGKNLY